MLSKDIPNQMSVKAPPFTGVYKKRKMQSKDLYCWFNIEDDVIFPHVSLHINDAEHKTFRYFHISFPILHKGGWDAESTKTSFSIQYEIAGGTINMLSATNTQNIRRVDGGGMNYQTMKDESRLLALRFVQVAMVQSALA